MGASKTVPPASTREETSSLQSKTAAFSQIVVTDEKHLNPIRMCNRFVQKGREVRPQQSATVLMKGPGGFFELPFEAVFGGPARNESRNYWRKSRQPMNALLGSLIRAWNYSKWRNDCDHRVWDRIARRA
jgi:hypothetical protein